jgi:hypothetical protein
MEVAIHLPEDVAAAVPWDNIPRHILEKIALEGYAEGWSEEQVRRLLGYDTRLEVHGFLAAHDVPLRYTLAHLEQDRILLDQDTLLPRLYDHVVVPPAVHGELQHPQTPPAVHAWGAHPPPWFEVQQPQQRLEAAQFPKLGAGETTTWSYSRRMSGPRRSPV